MLIIDTCQPNSPLLVEPGTLMVRKEEEFVQWLPLSSHVLPIPVFTSELKTAIPDLQTYLIGITPVSTDYNDLVEQYRSDLDTLDDYEQQPDLPFYNFNLSPKIQKIADELVLYLRQFL